MNKKTTIEREYKDGQIVKETETTVEWEVPRYIAPADGEIRPITGGYIPYDNPELMEGEI